MSRGTMLVAALLVVLAPAAGRAAEDTLPARVAAALAGAEGTAAAPPSPAPPSPAPPPGARPLFLSLQESVELALQHNLGLAVATLAREAARTEIRRARALFHPVAGLGVTVAADRPSPEAEEPARVDRGTASAFVRTLLPTGTALALSADVTRREEREAGTSTTEVDSGVAVTVTQPLLRGGRVFVATKPIRDAVFDLRAEEARLRAETLRVVAATKSAYYAVVLAQRIIELTEAAVERDRVLIEASQALFKAGLVTIRDVYSAEISRAKDTARLVSARADLETARNALVALLGLPLETEVVPTDRELEIRPVALAPESWIEAARRGRPEIREIRERLAKSELNVRTARHLLLPQLDLVGSYERSDIGATVERSMGLRGEAWSAGLVLSVPIGNVAARAALARAEIEHALLRQELLRRERQVELEVRAAIVKLRRSAERMKALATVVEQAKGKLEVARTRFALGLTTNLDITDAQEDLLDAETDLLRAIVDYNTGLAELEASVAGPL